MIYVYVNICTITSVIITAFFILTNLPLFLLLIESKQNIFAVTQNVINISKDADAIFDSGTKMIEKLYFHILTYFRELFLQKISLE